MRKLTLLLLIVLFACTERIDPTFHPLSGTNNPPECEPDCGGGGTHNYVWRDPTSIIGLDTLNYSWVGVNTWTRVKDAASLSFVWGANDTVAASVTLFGEPPPPNGGLVALAKAIVFIRRGGHPVAYKDDILRATRELIAEKDNPTAIDCGRQGVQEQLAVARHIPSWLIAADYMFDYMPTSLRDSLEDFFYDMVTINLDDADTTGNECNRSGDQSIYDNMSEKEDNWCAASIMACVAVGHYCSNWSLLTEANNRLRGYLGDRTYATWSDQELTSCWQPISSNKVPVGSYGTKLWLSAAECSISTSGAMCEDLDRSGECPDDPLDCIVPAGDAALFYPAANYSRGSVGYLQVAAEILKLNEHDTTIYNASYWAIERAYDFINDLSQEDTNWRFSGDDYWTPYLINLRYNRSEIGWDNPKVPEVGKAMDFTYFTHGPQQ